MKYNQEFIDKIESQITYISIDADMLKMLISYIYEEIQNTDAGFNTDISNLALLMQRLSKNLKRKILKLTDDYIKLRNNW